MRHSFLDSDGEVLSFKECDGCGADNRRESIHIDGKVFCDNACRTIFMAREARERELSTAVNMLRARLYEPTRVEGGLSAAWIARYVEAKWKEYPSNKVKRDIDGMQSS